ncbi:MAG: proline--tRNA ligase [Candidatus Schekmanbacteria bacterium]|nr:MAG: proline--tRNA ligase [Candidatus Schekmanbacteria bacterium]
MLWSKYLIPTLKENPSEAEVVSHRLMLRAGMIRKLSAGIYNYLPLGLRVIRKVENIIREEMNRAGAIEILMPAIQPAELWIESGRWKIYGNELLRILDRHKRDFCFGPTHEEVVTDIVRKEIKSYRQLPITLYQIQTKFRDEIRPRFGVMRAREFIMKDAYSFDADNEGAEESYKKMFDAYCRIFERCGLEYRAVEADTGTIGGKFSHEFMVLADTGEETIACCDRCDYAANLERAEIREEESDQVDEAEVEELKVVDTPGKKTIAEVSEFLNIPASRMLKTIVYLADGKPLVVVVRGDYEINEAKLRIAADCEMLELADDDTVKKVTGADTGFAGPVGLKDVDIIGDYSIKGIKNAVTGANENDKHIVNVNEGRDYKIVRYADIRTAVEGDRCPRCSEGRYKFVKGIEVGHVFKLGTKYSEAMGAKYLDKDGEEKLAVMGCYGIGVGRTVAAAIEQNYDKDGIIWTLPLAPFQVLVLPVNASHKESMDTAFSIYEELSDMGVEVLMDDRDERPGVKFKDADLIGIPYRITIGEKNLKNGNVEVRTRRTGENKLIEKNKVSQVLKELLHTNGLTIDS